MIYISRRDPSIDVLHLLYFVEVAKNKQICFCFCVFEHNKGFVGDDTTLVIGLILGVSRRNDHQVKMPYTKKNENDEMETIHWTRDTPGRLRSYSLSYRRRSCCVFLDYTVLDCHMFGTCDCADHVCPIALTPQCAMLVVVLICVAQVNHQLTSLDDILFCI